MNFVISIAAGVVATVAVLLTQTAFWRIRNLLPAGALFFGIKGVSDPCLVFVRRMVDPEKSGKFVTPVPNYSPVIEQPAIPASTEFKPCQNIPWVTSVPTAQAMSHVLNVLGQIQRVQNIQLCFHDADYGRWDSPMIIIGGGWKAERALSECDPCFTLDKRGFTLRATQDVFAPKSRDEDIGLLQKMVNPATGKPVWILHGFRGNGVVAASYALARWWRPIGWLYGKRTFGLLVSSNDRDGWQQSHVISLHPYPTRMRRTVCFWAWRKLQHAMRLPDARIQPIQPQSPVEQNEQ
jgi:hypothetical protein